MRSDYYNLIVKSSGLRESREENRDFIFSNPLYLNNLTEIAFNPKDKNHYKACWILELICEEQIEIITPFIANFCTVLPYFKKDSAIRPASKICLFIITSYYRKKDIQLSENQFQKITESCFDWLINDTKVASKCYSIRTLYIIGKHVDWIYPELRIILNIDYKALSAAYKADAREILKKINNQKK
jgi:hypothetical protein